jgi:hypothetical protein
MVYHTKDLNENNASRNGQDTYVEEGAKPINSKPIMLMDLHGAFPNIVGNMQSIPWH